MIHRSMLSMIRATESSQTVKQLCLISVKRATLEKKLMSRLREDWLPSRGVLALQMAPNVGLMNVPVAIVRLNQRILES